ncbi:MAG TPA: DoxX family protein [Polyangiaceae bacterium]|nr:DoxX family protein [Polyangiaceae bacterium]
MTAVAHSRAAGAAPSPKKSVLWTGRVLSALPVLAMVASASMKLMHAPQFVEQWVGKLGYQESALTGIGLLELACVILYVIPRTAVLGAVALTGYLGGAVATHVRIGDPGLAAPVVLGILAWAGLYLRDERVRALLPLRQ